MRLETTSAFDILELRWEGPFGWPGLRPAGPVTSLADSPVGASSGVYLWTVEYLDGFLIYAAGITRRAFTKRFREHTLAYRTGIYTLFDMSSLNRGVREEIWHGFWMRKRSTEKQSEYDRRREELRVAAELQLSNFRVFVAPLGSAPRLLERIEAAVMNALYCAPSPASDIPDRGMALAPRWASEQPITVRNIAGSLLHGLPSELEV